MLYLYMVITKQMCERLAQRIKQTKTTNKYYLTRLTNKQIARETNIPAGSIGVYLANDSIPLNRYVMLNNHLDMVIQDYNNLSSQDKRKAHFDGYDTRRSQ